MLTATKLQVVVHVPLFAGPGSRVVLAELLAGPDRAGPGEVRGHYAPVLVQLRL